MNKNFAALTISAMVLFSGAAMAAGETGRFLDSAGNVREKPEAKAKLVFTSKAGEEFTLVERQGEKWLKVQLKDGRAGWTNIINVKFDEPVSSKVENKPENKTEEKPAAIVTKTTSPSSESQEQLMSENNRLKDEITRLEQEKMLIESGSMQSQFAIEKLKSELKQMTALKESLEAENRQLKKDLGK